MIPSLKTEDLSGQRSGVRAMSLGSNGEVIDDFTTGYDGLDLKEKEIQQFIISHYTEGEQDTSRLQGKYKAALKLLKKIYKRQ